MRPKPKAFIVGVGPGAPQLVTPAVRHILAEAEIILGWDMDLLPVRDCIAGKHVFLQDVSNYMKAARAAVREARSSRKVLAIPRVGDPCLSSGLKGLLRALSGFEVEIQSGVSSVQLAAAIARINIDESSIISFHDLGDPEEKKRYLLGCFRHGRHIIALSSPDFRPEEVARWLIKRAVGPATRVVVCSSLSLPEQTISRTNLGSLVKREFPWLTITVIVNPSVSGVSQDQRLWRDWRKRRAKQISKKEKG
jgi:precorrin-6y C5,15-methyltransferase (decarboxylating) CbiE subunit